MRSSACRFFCQIEQQGIAIHTFTQKPKATQQTTPVESTMSRRRDAFRQNPESGSTLDLERTVENQAAERLQQSNTEDSSASRVSSASSGFGHDFSRISILSPSPVQVQPKLTVNTPGDLFEQEADRVADQVMRMSEPKMQRQAEPGGEEEVVRTSPWSPSGFSANRTRRRCFKEQSPRIQQ